MQQSEDRSNESLAYYLRRNNIEFDLLRTAFFGELENQKIDSYYLKKKITFRFLNYDLLKKLVFNGFLVTHNNRIFLLTYSGCASFIFVLGQIIKEFSEDPSENKDVAKRLYDSGFSFGGFKRDYVIHEQIVNSLFKNLENIGILQKKNSSVLVADEKTMVEISLTILNQLISNNIINQKDEITGLIAVLKTSFNLTDFSIGDLIKQADSDLQGKIKNILSRINYDDKPLFQLIRKKATDSIGEKEWLTSAAFWTLEAALHEDDNNEKWADYCKSRGYISLAIAYKRNKKFLEAGTYYEKSADIMRKKLETKKNADVQLANALQCKARHAAQNENFLEAAYYYSKASDIFKSLKMTKGSAFCKFRNLESQAKDQALQGEFMAASELIEQASEHIKPFEEKYFFSGMAQSWLFKKDHAKKIDDHKQVISCFKQAAENYKKSGSQLYYNKYMGSSSQTEAISMVCAGVSYGKVAQKFRNASEYYANSGDLQASTICEADSLKYLALECKNNGKLRKASEIFQDAKRMTQDLVYNCSNPSYIKNFRDGITWYEAMKIETDAHYLLFNKIPKEEKLDEVSRMLTHAADLFGKVGDYKHAQISSTFVMITMAIDAFHAGDTVKATSLIKEAKSRLPADFVFTIFEAEVKSGWQPLRYTMSMIENFNKYARKIETEKGFSFESRVRELLRKMHQQYKNIEPKVFKPEDEEIGIVFKDLTPIEIDAIGTQTIENRQQILIAEIKNVNKNVGKDEVVKFLKKINFIEVRYGKIARLQTLKKPQIDIKLFITSSDFEADAITVAEKNNITTLRKQEIIELMRKNQIYPIPNK